MDFLGDPEFGIERRFRGLVLDEFEPGMIYESVAIQKS